MAEKKFNGYAGITLTDSRLSFEPEEQRKKTNVVYIVLDDVGFAQLECYGSSIQTPNINRLAQSGLRYNNFHTTAICSATRASLLTGANHHAAGVATVVDHYTGYPNQLGHLAPSYATIAEILKEYGYANYAVGKWHLAPIEDIHEQGNVTYWPLQKGFDKYYGFLDGFTDQYHPSLVKDNSVIQQPKQPEEGYHLSEDLSDQAIHYLFEHTNGHPDQPFFLYLAYGCGHSPHQAPREYIEKYRHKFDEGWDVIREQWYTRQKELGIIPPDAKLTDRNPYVKPWKDLTQDEKLVYTRFMEVYAAFLEYTDTQIGRVLDYLEEIGERENTIIVFLSDNGASAEGGLTGRFVQERSMGILSDEEELQISLKHLDEMGSEFSSMNYPIGWAHVGNTPFQWYKSWVHAGGVKDPLIISYPEYIKDAGKIRTQYHHVSDITPTILDVLGLKKPDTIKGVHQKPFTGTSLKYTFLDGDAPNEKVVQYYEQAGNRGIWKDGWKLVTNHVLVDEYDQDVWELYHTDEDYSEAVNVAALYPDKVEELKNLWFAEAAKNNVFPLGQGSHVLFTEKRKRDNLEHVKISLKEEEYSYKNVIEPFQTDGLLAFNRRNNVIVIQLQHKNGQEGTLYSVGNRFGGYTAFIKDNRLCYTYNFHLESYQRAVSEALPEGDLTLRIETRLTDKGAEVILYVNGKPCGSTHIEKFINMLEIVTSIKDGSVTSVDPDNKLPFVYPVPIKEIVFKAAPYEFKTKELLEEFFYMD